MTLRADRVQEDIFVFISGDYAQVTATALLTPEGAIVVDTLLYPANTREMALFLDEQLGPDCVRYVINTHHHADHTYGTSVFGSAECIAHEKCRQILATRGAASLARAKRESPAFADVQLRIPDLTFRREMHLRLGQQHLRLFHLPGHSPDGIGVYATGAKALIASDLMMPVPYIARGNIEQMRHSLRTIAAMEPDFVVQGHGDVLLRGEVVETVDQSLHYLDAIDTRTQEIVDQGRPPEALREIDIESCGLSRIPLDGLVSDLHLANLVSLYKTKRQV